MYWQVSRAHCPLAARSDASRTRRPPLESPSLKILPMNVRYAARGITNRRGPTATDRACRRARAARCDEPPNACLSDSQLCVATHNRFYVAGSVMWRRCGKIVIVHRKVFGDAT